jgi:hypothetical protein
MHKLSDFFYRFSYGWVALTATLVFVLFSVLTLPGQSRIAQTYSQGSGSPDTSLFYNAEDLYSMAGLYGAQGREVYLKARWTFDLAFPVVYSFFFIAAISWLLNRITPPGSRWRLLNLVPVAAFVLDLLENTATSLVMARFPLHCPPGELLAPILTPIKWLMVSASMLILLLASAYHLVAAIRRKKTV